MTAAGLIQGASIALLLQLLSVIGVGAPAQAPGRLARALAAAGLPMTLGSVLLLFVAAAILENLFRLWQQSTTRRFLGEFMTQAQVELYEAYLRANWNFWLGRHAGHMSSLLTAYIARLGAAFEQSMLLLSHVILCLVLLASACLLSLPLTLMALGIGAGVLWTMKSGFLRAQKAGERIGEQNKALQETMQEHVNAAKLIKSSAMEASSADSFSRLAYALNETEVQANINLYRLTAFFEPAVLALLSLGFYLALSRTALGPAKALVLLYVLFRLATRVNLLQQEWHQTLVHAPAYAALVEETRRAVEQAEEPGRGRPCARLESELVLESVRYAYRPGLDTLKTLTLRVGARKTVALVGASGSGKSTLLDLAVGLLTPEEGRVLIDGKDLRGLDLGAWRERIGYVSQDSFLFHDTIAANIRWADPGAPRERVEEAARLAHAHDFIRALPEGYETVVGHRGVRLSGGERQRIALARALLRSPSLLILDEATSALDAASEKAVLEAIDGLRRRVAILIVAHRLATVRGADYLYVLDRGGLVQEGTWAELTGKPGKFLELWSLQNGSTRAADASSLP